MTTACPTTSAVSRAVETPRPARRRSRVGIVLGSHALVDVYAAFVPALLGLLETRCALTTAQAAMVLGASSVASGVSQPLAAWLSDRFDSRLFGPIGLALAAVCLSLLGAANDFPTLLALVALGAAGSGMFHPVGAASAGQLAESGRVESGGANGRSMALSLFFVAGMVGGMIGASSVTRLTLLPGGFTWLAMLMIPGVLAAMILHRAIARVPHRADGHRSTRFTPRDAAARWGAMVLLYLTAALRFIVNIALLYLIVRLAQRTVAADVPGLSRPMVAEAASPIVGNLNTCVFFGMLLGGLASGWMVRAGREKWPLVLVPIVGAVCVALLPLAPFPLTYVVTVLAGAGFAAMVPVALSVAQRLLPHRTSLASGLVLGGAWALAFLGPAGAERCLQSLGWTLEQTFAAVGGVLALSGVLSLALPAALLRRSVTDVFAPARRTD